MYLVSKARIFERIYPISRRVEAVDYKAALRSMLFFHSLSAYKAPWAKMRNEQKTDKGCQFNTLVTLINYTSN